MSEQPHKPDRESFLDRLRRGVCPNCGEKGPHFVPPAFGDPGYYACEQLNRIAREKQR